MGSASDALGRAGIEFRVTHLEVPTEACQTLKRWRDAGERIVFTNGVFDLLHPGHIEYLEEACGLGDRLVVGINTDASVERLKGPERPLISEGERAELLAALASVDLVVLFDEDTPERLIREIRPDFLVKGGDWAVEDIVGREFVESLGGRVLTIRLREELSTSALVQRIVAGKSARAE